MSDPVKNEEIEDVLSSIRRLVSESGGVTDEAGDETANSRSGSVSGQNRGAEPDEQASESTDRLVLTPALRVADDDNAPDGGDQDVLESDSGEVAEHVSDEASAETRQEGDSAQTHDEEGAQEPSAHLAAEAETGEGVAADIDGAYDSQGDKEHDALHAVDEPAAETEAEDPEAGAELPEAEQEGETLKDRIQQLETAVLQTESDWEEDMDTGGDNAPRPVETLQWEDHTDEEDSGGVIENESPGASKGAGEDLSASDPADDLAGEFDFMGDDEAVLDEDALREMVADIVRQELQGALGERITRNVRKLVRREIHRALMAQELD